tara:strand:+ start:355 stop:573 length:219 start_codon:yes stop_codon:yes gene_type:complete
MCGVTGIFGPIKNDSLKDVAELMTDSLVHRGPDDDGVWLDADSRIALGHRRLPSLTFLIKVINLCCPQMTVM